jgi:hypothetical protein
MIWWPISLGVMAVAALFFGFIGEYSEHANGGKKHRLRLLAAVAVFLSSGSAAILTGVKQYRDDVQRSVELEAQIKRQAEEDQFRRVELEQRQKQHEEAKAIQSQQLDELRNLRGDLQRRVIPNRTAVESDLASLARRTRFSPDAAMSVLELINAGLISDPNGDVRKNATENQSSLPAKVMATVRVNGRSIADLSGGQPFGYEWSSTNATACIMVSPTGPSGVSPNGKITVPPDHPWYPGPGTIRLISFSCTNGIESTTDVAMLVGALNGR